MVKTIGCWLLLSLAAAENTAVAANTPDALEIVKRAMNADKANQDLIKNYTMTELRIERSLDDRGSVTKTETKRYEVLFVEGRKFERLVERNGSKLSGKEAQKENERFHKEIEKYKQRRAEGEGLKERQRREEMMSAVPQAFKFTLRGEERVDGRLTYVIDAQRKPDFKPHSREQEFISKVQGSMAVDKETYQIVRADVELMEPVSFGWFIAKLDQGSRIHFNQSFVNGEIWLPKRLQLRASFRLLGKRQRLDNETLMSDYKKYQAESRVISVQTN